MPQSDGFDMEPAWVALFALLRRKLSGSYEVMGRHHVRPPQLPPESQPALFLVQVRETYKPGPAYGAPAKPMLSGFIILYFQAPAPLLEEIGNEQILGVTILNDLLKGIRGALLPDDITEGKLTLGGLVDHCWLEGDADMDPGIYTQQGAAILPVKMLLQ